MWQGKPVSSSSVSLSVLSISSVELGGWELYFGFRVLRLGNCVIALGIGRCFVACGWWKMVDSTSGPVGIGFASAAKATHDWKAAERRERRLIRLQQEAKAAERVAQALKRGARGRGQKESGRLERRCAATSRQRGTP